MSGTTKRIAIFFILIFLSLQASASKNYPLRDRLLDFSIQFAEDVLHSPSDIKRLNDVRPKEISDSVTFNTMRLFGRSMFVSSRQTMAFEYFKQALAIIGESDNLSRDALTFKAYCYLLLGTAADETGMQQLSMEYYLKGVEIAENMKSSPLLGDFYNNIGVCYSRTDNYAKAEPYFRKALENNLKLGQKAQTSINYINLSESRLKAKDFDGAVDFALKAIQNIDEKEDPDNYYSIYAHLGFLYLNKREYDMAQIWLDKAYRHQVKLKTKANLFETCLMMMNLYAETGKTDLLNRYKNETERLVE